jgi:DNA-binding transcriptional MerR regulator
MLSIGRFADATGLTVKALRHYDEIGLFAPAHVDPDTGYRYYDPAQVEDAVTIRRLRALELPLDEIAGLLDADADALRDRLAAHGHRVAEEVRDKHSLLIELSALVESGGGDLAVEIRDGDVLSGGLRCDRRPRRLVRRAASDGTALHRDGARTGAPLRAADPDRVRRAGRARDARLAARLFGVAECH